VGYGNMGFDTLLVIHEILLAEPSATAAEANGHANSWRPSRQ
jgi:hypothetical protein